MWIIWINTKWNTMFFLIKSDINTLQNKWFTSVLCCLGLKNPVFRATQPDLSEPADPRLVSRKYRVFQFFKKTEQTIPKIFKTVALNTRFFWPYHKVIIIVCKIFMTFQWKHCLLNCNECWMDVSVFNTKFNLLYHSGQLTSPTVLVSKNL